VTFTEPDTRLFGWNPNVTERGTGAVVTVKIATLVAVPPAVVREIVPVVAAVGTVAVTEVAVLVENVAVTPLNLTEVTPVRFVPVMTTLVPTLPLVGVNDVIVGTPVTVKLAALFAVPLGVVTCSGPVVAPTGTVAVIEVAEVTVNVEAAAVLNVTPVVPQKFVPVITTEEPTAPLVGANDVIVAAAAGATVKLAALGVSAAVVSTVIVPVEAPAGTTAVAIVSLEAENVTAAVPPPPLKVTPVGAPADVKPLPVMVTVVPTTPHTGENDVTAAADAGSAATNTPTTPRASASAVARAETFFFGNLIRGSSFLGVVREPCWAPRPVPTTAARP
jgi:hypothetical protein